MGVLFREVQFKSFWFHLQVLVEAQNSVSGFRRDTEGREQPELMLKKSIKLDYVVGGAIRRGFKSTNN